MNVAVTPPHRLDRTITIRADRATIFAFFTDTARWACWWGAGSTVDPRPGGRVVIRYPNGVEIVGEVLEIVSPERFSFTYGYATGAPIPPGGSRVTIHLDAAGQGTRLRLTHEFSDAAVRDEHVQGWRYQLSLFANAVADDLHASAGTAVDEWFAAWSEPDAATRDASLSRIAIADIRFADRFSAVEGLKELSTHLAAAQRFMPRIRLARVGEVRHCQGMVLADWAASGHDGQERARGTNVFVFGPRGLVESVTGFWNRHPGS